MKAKPTQKNIPEGWSHVTVADVAVVKMGQSPSSVAYNELGNGLPLIQGNNDMKGGKTISRIWTSEITKTAEKGEIILTVRAPVGAVGLAHDKICIGRGVCAIKSTSQAFLWHYFKYFEPKWSHLEQGSTFTAVNGADIRKIKINLPPLPEQKRIVEVLETWDKAILKLIQKIENKRSVKKGLIQELLSGKRRLSSFKGKWQTFSLKEISKIYDGTHQTPTYVDEGIPFYSVEHVTSNDFENTKYISEEVYAKEIRKVRIEKGDILMTRIGSIGAIKYVDWDVKASFYVTLALLKIDKKFDSRAISFFLTTRNFQDELYGKTLHVAFPNKINLGDIGECKIYLPEDIKEQKAIANILLTADKEIIELEKKLQIIKDQKNYLLNNLITGTIRTPEKLSTHN